MSNYALETGYKDALPPVRKIEQLTRYMPDTEQHVRDCFARANIVQLLLNNSESEHESPRALLEFCRALSVSDTDILGAALSCNGHVRLIINT
jgi:hypothetical protein